MIALVDVELRRLWSRRLVRVLAVALFVGIVTAPPLVDWAFRERARIERDADLERCVQAKPPKVRDGVTMPTIPADIAAPAERERLCERAIPRRDGTFHLREVGEVLRPMGALLIIGAFAVGASVAAGATALSYAIAVVGRGTAAALGGGLAYVLVLESVLSSNFKPLRPWLMLNNAIVFVKGQFEGGPGGDVPGRTVAAAAVILAAYLGAALTTAAGIFRRRDVT